jgi:membrane protease subunit HflK
MGWDDGDKGNPWKPKDDKGPADLDAIVRDFQRKLAGVFGRRGGGGSGPDGSSTLSSGLIGFGLVVAVGVWAFTGFYQVAAAEIGVVLRFGEYQSSTQPGLHWHVPWPIETVELVNTGQTVGFQYQGSMLTRDENIVNVEVIVQYRRTDPLAYLFNLRDPEKTLNDVTASAIREVIGKNELDFILTDGRLDVSSRTQDLLQATLDTYGTGITVYEVNLQEANFPAAVEASVQDAIMAREDRERAILAAESYRNDILPRARGEAARRRENAAAYRDQVIADSEGESDRFVQVLRQYERAPEVTRERLYLETLETILKNSNKVLVDTEGGNNLLYLPLDQLMRRNDSLSPGSGSSLSLSDNRDNLDPGSSSPQPRR